MLRIIIIDDEKKTIDGMKFIFDKFMPQHEVVATLLNPYEVFDYLGKCEVDIIFTDVKMPEMNGVELTTRIHREYPYIYIVVLSAYPDYDFVRLCLKNGAFDYLLKPAPYQSIIEIVKRIEGLVINVRKEQHLQKESLLIKEALTSGKKLPSSWDDAAELQLFVCSPGVNSPLDNSDLTIISEIFGTHLEDSSKPFWSDQYIIALKKPVEEDKSKILLENCVNSFRQKGLDIYCTSSVVFKNSINSIRDALSVCQKSIDFFIFNQISPVVLYKEYCRYKQAKSEVKISYYISGKHISNLILTGKTAEIEQYLVKGIKDLLSKNVYFDPVKVKHSLLEEIFIITSEFKGVDASLLSADSIKIDLFAEIKKIKTMQQLVKWMYDYVNDLIITIMKQNIPSYIRKAIEFINKNYMYDISLNSVAESIYLNPEYFSTQFKKVMGMSFTKYLNKVRIDFSKELLKQSDLKINQVAEMVGFNEPTYFSAVFKQIEGITPVEYRR